MVKRATSSFLYSKPPQYEKAPLSLQSNVNRFIQLTEGPAINSFAHGENLTKLIELANKTCAFIKMTNPYNISGEKAKAHARWELFQISRITFRVCKAMKQKQRYYEQTFIGKMKALFLRLFGLWNKGRTACIQTAENFLLLHNASIPTKRHPGGHYEPRHPIKVSSHPKARTYKLSPLIASAPSPT